METIIDRKIKSLVYKKYGESEVLHAVQVAEASFWHSLHNMLIGSDKPDESIGVDIDEALLAGAIEYVYQNDRELQNRLDTILEGMGL